VTHEYDTPGKLIEYCEPDLDEKMLSRFVYSGRVRLEKSPGVPHGGRAKGVGCKAGASARLSAVYGDLG